MNFVPVETSPLSQSGAKVFGPYAGSVPTLRPATKVATIFLIQGCDKATVNKFLESYLSKSLSLAVLSVLAHYYDITDEEIKDSKKDTFYNLLLILNLLVVFCPWDDLQKCFFTFFTLFRKVSKG